MWKNRSRSEKVMIIIIIMLIIGIITRWGYIKDEVGGSVMHYFTTDSVTVETAK